MGFIIGAIVLVLDIVALARLWTQPGNSERRLLWTLVILLLPLLGMILFFLLGDRKS